MNHVFFDMFVQIFQLMALLSVHAKKCLFCGSHGGSAHGAVDGSWCLKEDILFLSCVLRSSSNLLFLGS